MILVIGARYPTVPVICCSAIYAGHIAIRVTNKRLGLDTSQGKRVDGRPDVSRTAKWNVESGATISSFPATRITRTYPFGNTAPKSIAGRPILPTGSTEEKEWDEPYKPFANLRIAVNLLWLP
jgi:hypothetical protein